MSFKPLSSYLTFFVIIFVAGCNTGETLPITISVTPSTVAAGPGQSVQFSATITSTLTGTAIAATSNNDSSGVNWAAVGGSIGTNGEFVASSDATSTTAYVIATSKKDHTKSANAVVHLVGQGHVASTANGQVATYSLTPGAPANV